MLISIIIPVYNAEKFIDRSVNSIACQLTDETELLLVDDGSTDDSGRICDEYAKKNPNIHVIHQENGGSSSARNAGLLAAKGEYISFLDADDYVDPGIYQKVTEVIKKYHPDCLDFGWRYISRHGDVSPNSNQVPKDTLLGADMLKDHIIPTLLNLRKDRRYFVYDFVWNKLYRKDKIISGGVRFSGTRRTWEDRLFVLNYLCYCENYYSMSHCFYNYVDVPNSKSQRFNVDRLRIIVENYGLYKEMFGENYDFDTDDVNTYWACLMENMILQFLRQTKQKKMITDAVSAVLQENVVKHWFSRRIPRNSFEQKVGALIVAGETDHVIRCYEKKAAKDRINIFAEKIKKCVIHVLRKMIGK